MRKSINKNLLIKNKVKSFLEKATNQKIQGDQLNLIDKGIINSFTMIKLITFIEKEFNVDVQIESLTPQNFNTLKKIAKKIMIWQQK